jgi:hypothetical protein
MKVQALTGTQWAIIGGLLLIPFGIPITQILSVIIAVILFVLTYLIASIAYFLFATIVFNLVRFYARYALRIGLLAYIALWTFVGYGVFDNNPVVSVVELWIEFITWGF